MDTIYSRAIASQYLEGVQIDAPKNIEISEKYAPDQIIEWGSYSVGLNVYPNVYEHILENSPTATSLIKKLKNFICANIPEDIKTLLTAHDFDFVNTFENQVTLLAQDWVVFNGCFAFWVGYNSNGQIDQFKRLPVSWLRYYKSTEQEQQKGYAKRMIAYAADGMFSQLEKADRSLYFPYNPNRDELSRQYKLVGESKGDEYCSLKAGQVLFYNLEDTRMYPNCTADGLIATLLSDIALNTGMLSVLTSGKLAQTYTINNDSSGIERILADTLDSHIWGDVLGADRAGIVNNAITRLRTAPNYGAEYNESGVKAMGSTLAVRSTDPNADITKYIKQLEFPRFVDDFEKIQDRINRTLALRFEVNHDYIFRMESGVLNQQNMDTLIDDMDKRFEKARTTIESVLNSTVLSPELSVLNFAAKLKPFKSVEKQIETTPIANEPTELP